MGVGVVAVAPDVFHGVARSGVLAAVREGVGEFERGEHLLVREEPVAVFVREVVGAVLEEDLDRLDGRLADESGIEVAAGGHGLAVFGGTIPDGDVAPDHADDVAELVGIFPSGGEGADGAATRAADDTALGIVGDFVGLLQHRDELPADHARVGIVEGVVFVGAIVGVTHPEIVGIFVANVTRCDEEPDGDGDFFFVDQIGEDVLDAEGAVGIGGALAVVEDQEVGVGLAGVLIGDEDPVTADGARKVGALEFEGAFEFALGNTILDERVGGERVVAGFAFGGSRGGGLGGESAGCEEEEREDESEFHAGLNTCVTACLTQAGGNRCCAAKRAWGKREFR